MELPVATERGAADELARTLREAIQRLNRRIRQARPVGDLTFSQLSALTSLQLAGALTPRELADVDTTPQEVAAWRYVPNSFISTALREGKTLYARPQ